jgi:hypothetical protein
MLKLYVKVDITEGNYSVFFVYLWIHSQNILFLIFEISKLKEVFPFIRFVKKWSWFAANFWYFWPLTLNTAVTEKQGK